MANTQKFAPRLSKNNIDLTSILEDINNLPPAGTEDISAELDAQTEAINSLLSMVNRKVAENNGAGEWVWKKCWKYTVNLTQTTTGTNPTKFKVTGSGNNTDFTDVGFIVGKKFVSDLGHTLEFLDETHMRHTAQNGSTVNEYTFTWDAANSTVEMPAQWSTTHTFTAQETLRTKEFIVSAGEFDYPDREYGDDGYWYAQYYEDYDKPENIAEYIDIFGTVGALTGGLTPENFGFTKMAVDTFSFSSRGQMATNTISHSLNDVPKMAIIIPKTKPTANYNLFAFFGTNPYGVSGNKSNGSFASYENSGSFGTVQGNFRSEILRVGTSITNAYYEAGVEYTLITMA